MRVGIPKERDPDESRVAAVPDSVPKLVRAGLEVLIERGAGLASGFEDAAYEAKGAKLVDAAAAFGAELVLTVQRPDTGSLRSGQTLVCMANPLGDPEGVSELAAAGVTAFSLELMPRISRAQSMDVLSSMANIAGYKAVC